MRGFVPVKLPRVGGVRGARTEADRNAGEPGPTHAGLEDFPWIGETFEIQLSAVPPSLCNAPFGILCPRRGGASPPYHGGPRSSAWHSVRERGLRLRACGMSGLATWMTDIPRDSSLLGLRFCVQGMVSDFGVNPLNFRLTNTADGVLRGWKTPGAARAGYSRHAATLRDLRTVF